MGSTTIRRFGGTAALLMGALYLLVIPTSALAFLVTPGLANPASPSDPTNFFPIMARAPIGFVLVGLEFGAAAVLGLAVIPALAEIVGPASPGWIRWVGAIAYVGFAVTGISSFHSAAILPDVTARYVSGDAVTQAAIAAQYTPLGASQLDGWGLLQFGGVGLWVLVLGLVSLRNRLLTRDAACLGVALGAAWLAQTAGEIVRSQVVVGVAGLTGTLAAVAWFIRVGVILRRTPPAESVGLGRRVEAAM